MLFFFGAILAASIRHARPSFVPQAVSGGSRLRRILARPCRAVEPAERNDWAVEAVAAAAKGLALDWEELDQELQNASPLEIMDSALRIFGNEIAIAFR